MRLRTSRRAVGPRRPRRAAVRHRVFETLRNAIRIDVEFPRLGTSRGHGGDEPVTDPTSPKRSAGIPVPPSPPRQQGVPVPLFGKCCDRGRSHDVAPGSPSPRSGGLRCRSRFEALPAAQRNLASATEWPGPRKRQGTRRCDRGRSHDDGRCDRNRATTTCGTGRRSPERRRRGPTGGTRCAS